LKQSFGIKENQYVDFKVYQNWSWAYLAGSFAGSNSLLNEWFTVIQAKKSGKLQPNSMQNPKMLKNTFFWLCPWNWLALS